MEGDTTFMYNNNNNVYSLQISHTEDNCYKITKFSVLLLLYSFLAFFGEIVIQVMNQSCRWLREGAGRYRQFVVEQDVGGLVK